jgi:beta-1,2-xylosyltransferase
VPNTHTKTPISKDVWEKSHRIRFHTLATSNSSTKHAVMTPKGSRDGTYEIGHWAEDELRETYLDGHLEGVWACEKDDKACEKHRHLYSGQQKDPNERSNDYKYVLDLDGESWSKRFPKLMAAKNMVIKAGVFPEWNMATLPAWFAYVPANIDYSDIFSIMAFFRGHPGTLRGSHERVARRIASNGQCWVERTWRKEDMQAYSFRLYLEYARLVHPDRDSGAMVSPPR